MRENSLPENLQRLERTESLQSGSSCEAMVIIESWITFFEPSSEIVVAAESFEYGLTTSARNNEEDENSSGAWTADRISCGWAPPTQTGVRGSRIRSITGKPSWSSARGAEMLSPTPRESISRRNFARKASKALSKALLIAVAMREGNKAMVASKEAIRDSKAESQVAAD